MAKNKHLAGADFFANKAAELSGNPCKTVFELEEITCKNNRIKDSNAADCKTGIMAAMRPIL